MTAAIIFIILVTTLPLFLILKKKPATEAMELELGYSEHIIFKKQKLELLKRHINSELKNKKRIYDEFDKIADLSLNKGEKLIFKTYLFILELLGAPRPSS